MDVTSGGPRHVVAVIGGAVSGAEVASILASRGLEVVVFDQQSRPYGKIEDGLPRWHVEQREKEYERIDESLGRSGVHFVPVTKIGRDITWGDLSEWGFSAIFLANGAWRDRSLPLEGVDAYQGRGFHYQNSFVYWFNHYLESGYQGEACQVEDGAIVIGGGLASIDVLKILQVETARCKLAERGIHVDMLTLEKKGISTILEQNGLKYADLGLTGATLYYRRRVQDMPLAETRDKNDPKEVARAEGVREKLLGIAMKKFLFKVAPLHKPVDKIVEGDRLAGIRFEGPAGMLEVRASLTVSSIGSIPEAIPGLPMRGELYAFTDYEKGTLSGLDNVYGVGNVCTGKGNIAVSRRHARQVIEDLFRWAGESEKSTQEAVEVATAGMEDPAKKVLDAVSKVAPASPEAIERIHRRVKARHQQIGYSAYADWIARHAPKLA